MQQFSVTIDWAGLPQRAAQALPGYLAVCAQLPPQKPQIFAANSGQDTDFTSQLLRLLTDTKDPLLTAIGLRKLAADLPAKLPENDKLLLRAGSLSAFALPWAAVPVAQKIIATRLSSFFVTAALRKDSADNTLHKAVNGLSANRHRVGTQLYTEPALGPIGGAKLLQQLQQLINIPDNAYLLIDPAMLAAGDAWGVQARASRAAAILRDLITAAAAKTKLVILAPQDYTGALLTMRVTELLHQDTALKNLTFGVSLRAEVPESAQFLSTITEYSKKRILDGAPPLTVRITTASSATDASVQALTENLPLPIFSDPLDTQAAALQLTAAALASPDLVTVFAEDSLTLVAAALALPTAQHPLTIELRAGVTDTLAFALAATGVPCQITLPIVAKQQLHTILPYLLQLATEANSALSALAQQQILNPHCLEAAEIQQAAFAHLEMVCLAVPGVNFAPKRTQNLATQQLKNNETAFFYPPLAGNTTSITQGLTATVMRLHTHPETGQIQLTPAVLPRQIPVISDSGFRAEPATDIQHEHNRAWYLKQLAVSASSQAATQPEQAENPAVAPPAEQSPAQVQFGNAPMRAGVLRKIGVGIRDNRAVYTQLLAKLHCFSPAQLDAQLNYLIDSAKFLAQQVQELQKLRGATLHAAGNVLLTLDDPRFSVQLCAALLREYAVGNQITLIAPKQLLDLVQYLQQHWQSCGLPATGVRFVCANSTVQVASIAAKTLTKQDFAHAQCFGGGAVPALAHTNYPQLQLYTHTRNASTAVVTRAADTAVSAAAIVRSAFTGDAAVLRPLRTVITVGKCQAFLTQLVDATRAVATSAAKAADPLQTVIAPLEAAPTPAQLRQLTTLAPGEKWLLKPRRLDSAGRFWTPGIKTGIKNDSDFWQLCAELPLIAVRSCRSFATAITLANQLGSGSAATLYSWESSEILSWLDQSNAATLTVNKPSDILQVERLPHGNWQDGTVASLLGGPHQLLPLGLWQASAGSASRTLHLRGLEPEISLLIENSQEWLDYAAFDRLRRAALSDALTWRTQLGVVRDIYELGIEHNFLRYWATPAHIRIGDDATLENCLRVLCAAVLVGAPLSVSTALSLPNAVATQLHALGITVQLETDTQWLTRLNVHTDTRTVFGAWRIRIVGTVPPGFNKWHSANPRIGVWSAQPTLAGPLELFVFLREQAVSICNHRYGLMADQPELQDWLRILGR